MDETSINDEKEMITITKEEYDKLTADLETMTNENNLKAVSLSNLAEIIEGYGQQLNTIQYTINQFATNLKKGIKLTADQQKLKEEMDKQTVERIQQQKNKLNNIA